MSQRAVAKELGISQALLSHYENGVREPGLVFVTNACNFYHVSADFLLGRTLTRDGTVISNEDLYDYTKEKDNVLHGSILATLNKKLIINSILILFDLLGKVGNKAAINAASEYIGTSVYRMFRHLYRADGFNNEDFFSIPVYAFTSGVSTADSILTEAEFVEALAQHKKEHGAFPDMTNEALSKGYPGLYQSLLQIIHNTGARIKHAIDSRKSFK